MSLFWGIFPDVFFIMFPFPDYVFTLCFLGGPRRPVGCPKKRHFFGAKKYNFLTEKMTFFSRETIRCFLAPALSLRRRIPYLSANRLEPRISTSKLANSKQQMSKSILQFLKCTLISSPLVRWKWPTQVQTLGNTLVGLRFWNDAIHDCRTSGQNVFLGIWKNAVFSGHGSRMTVRKNHGYLAGWLSGWLAGWLAMWQLALWLPGWLLGY